MDGWIGLCYESGATVARQQDAISATPGLWRPDSQYAAPLRFAIKNDASHSCGTERMTSDGIGYRLTDRWQSIVPFP
jgi:hypothetical protein